jgi:uncharacterized protein
MTPEVLAGVQRDAKDLGPLWRIEKDGRVSWLYGTVHFGRIEWQAPGPQVSGALRGADLLAVEMVGSPRQTSAAKVEKPSQIEPPQQVLSQSVPETLARKIDGVCSWTKTAPGWYDAWINETSAFDLTLWMTRVRVQKEGFYSEFGIDAMLARTAVTMNKPIVGLEKRADRQVFIDSLENSMTAPNEAVPQAKPGIRQKKTKLELMEELLNEKYESLAKSINQDIVVPWTTARSDDCTSRRSWCWQEEKPSKARARMEKLLAVRDRHMADELERLHESGKQVFAAVGMLHVRPSALPALMKEKGFSVEFVSNAN